MNWLKNNRTSALVVGLAIVISIAAYLGLLTSDGAVKARERESRMQAYLATIPSVFGIDDNLKEGPRELQLRIDDERAGPYGLTFEDLANALRAANDGIVSSSFRAPSAVDDDLATSISVGRNLEARFADIRARFPQVDLIYGGEYQETNEAMANTFAAFPVALLLIYMLLATLFRSYLQPFIVLTSIPLGFAGIVFGVGALDYKISFSLLYASVGLAGVVVNDALVLVDFINRARRNGMPMLEAVAQAGAQRLRPVILTTMTTVAALLPMAFGLLGSSKSYGPFAAAIAFGLLFAMFGTLFVIPLSYATLSEWEDRGRRLFATLREARGSATGSGPMSGSNESETGVPV